MSITAISRDQGINVNLVRLTSSNTLAECIVADYLTVQNDNITALNFGEFEWLASDMVVLYASDGHGIFEFDGDDFSTLIQLPGGNGAVTLPVVDGDFVMFDGTLGALKDLGFSASNPAKSKVVMAGSAVQVGYIAHFVDTSGTIDDTAGAVQNDGSIYAGKSAVAGALRSYPSAATSGYLGLTGVANSGDYSVVISNSSFGQSAVISIPDPGAATAKFLLDTGTNASATITTLTSTTANITNLKYGATPVAQVDPASCTISGAAGASNVCTVTIQLKDGSGTNMTRSIPFKVYASSAADGLTLASAASTGFALVSGGLSLQNGAAVTTQFNAISSATGGCVLSLTDTAKQTSYLVLVFANGVKISAQLSSGSYGA